MAAKIWQLVPLGPPAHDPSASERPRSSWPSLDGIIPNDGVRDVAGSDDGSEQEAMDGRVSTRAPDDGA